MSVYFLARNITAVQSSAHATGSQVVKPPGPQNVNLPPQSESFELVVTGTGAVSATAALVGSNDVVNYEAGAPMTWNPIGQALTATGTDSANAASMGDANFQFYGAYITAISGTNASATVRMAA